MPAKLTTQDFIDRARAVHGDKYGYAFSVYQSTHTKVFIHCKKHGMFEQRPDDHINKKCGCNTCGCTVTCEKTSLTTDEFIKKATQVHGDRFDYSLVDYKTSQKKVKIICKLHGVFEQKPNNHLNGSICFKCGLKNRSDKRRDTLDLFLNKAKSIHCDKYDYSEVNYLGSQINIKITCPEHGYFLQLPNHHLRGVGCPGCAKSGFDRTKVGFLYILRSCCGQYMKIGITNKPDQRQVQLTRDTPFSFKRIELIKGPGEQVADLEKELLAEYQPAEFNNHFNGYTEWRLWDESIRHKLLTSKIQG